VRGGAPRAGAIAFAVVLLTSALGSAQEEPFEPSPLLDADVSTVTRAEIDAALPARAACHNAVEVLNERGLRWERVRAGLVDLKEFERQLKNAEDDWPVARGLCGQARKALGLPQDLLTRRVLDHDARRLDRLSDTMKGIEKGWLEQIDVEDINARLAAYRAEAADYAAWTRAAAEFWQVEWLREGTKGCVDDVDAEVRKAATSLRMLLVEPESERDDAVMSLVGKVGAIDSARLACSPEPATERMDLELLGKLLAVYRDALEGLAAGDDERVRDAMKAEQAHTARRARCAKEHAAGDPSTLCRPSPKVDETDDETGAPDSK